MWSKTTFDNFDCIDKTNNNNNNKKQKFLKKNCENRNDMRVDLMRTEF